MSYINHFIERCRDRGLADVAHDLYGDLLRALELLRNNDPRAHGHIEHVFDLSPDQRCESKGIYRFCVEDQQFFAIVVDRKTPITLLTREMVPFYRQARKKPSKQRGAKIQRINP